MVVKRSRGRSRTGIWRDRALTKGGGKNLGTTVQLPTRASSFLGGSSCSPEEGHPVSVGRTVHQRCEDQSLHTVPWHLPEEEKMPSQSSRHINSRARG